LPVFICCSCCLLESIEHFHLGDAERLDMDKAISELLELVDGKLEKLRNGTTNMRESGGTEFRVSIIEEPDGTFFYFQPEETSC